MNISQKVMVDCQVPPPASRQGSADSVFEPSLNQKPAPLEFQILNDWLQEASHQLTRSSANNTVRVAADNLLVTIATKHGFFKEVAMSTLAYLRGYDFFFKLKIIAVISHWMHFPLILYL